MSEGAVREGNFTSCAPLARLDSLTGLRFVAAFCILNAHATGWIVNFRDAATPLGYLGAATGSLGMPLFFVLSGFVIHYNYGGSFRTQRFRWSAAAFLAARIARLYPLFAACLCFTFVCDGILSWAPRNPWSLVNWMATF